MSSRPYTPLTSRTRAQRADRPSTSVGSQSSGTSKRTRPCLPASGMSTVPARPGSSLHAALSKYSHVSCGAGGSGRGAPLCTAIAAGSSVSSRCTTSLAAVSAVAICARVSVMRLTIALYSSRTGWSRVWSVTPARKLGGAGCS